MEAVERGIDNEKEVSELKPFAIIFYDQQDIFYF